MNQGSNHDKRTVVLRTVALIALVVVSISLVFAEFLSENSSLGDPADDFESQYPHANHILRKKLPHMDPEEAAIGIHLSGQSEEETQSLADEVCKCML